ncbi:RNA-binding domain-containing protein [Streptantibioticus ferralitis]|uniref:ATP-binding protein n=1 Tax=Streptantibioticus ferralitis TaxID=236510 RepID=A0ABT5Z381_9ACTN|nr:ATP-binding protein [Streptantibioticus ferralitis]MDF2258293.1 ATP-binding protein [Streptantibioticus ferralitis]
MVSELLLDRAREAVVAQAPDKLLGLRECVWLDAKRDPYHLSSPAQIEELTKDVAAFANAPSGGLLLLGISTRREGDSEVLCELCPFERDAVNLDQVRKLIRERITPPPRGVDVDWIPCDEGRGIVAVDVPPQPSSSLPYVLAAPVGKHGQVNQHTVVVPLREADGTHWLPRSEVQRLLAAGWASRSGPSPQFLASVVEKAVSEAHDRTQNAGPVYRPGQGLPAREQEFAQVYEALRGTVPIGAPSSEVLYEGVGVVQHFAPATPSGHGWVLCALPQRRPVAVAEPLWLELLAAGGAAQGGDPTGALGYPVADPSEPAIFDADTPVLELEAGRWGRGRLVRGADGQWRWEPVPRMGFDLSPSARSWTGDRNPPQLRLRALVRLLWADAGTLEVSTDKHRQLKAALPTSSLARAVAVLSTRRGAHLPADAWMPGPHSNSLNQVSYSSTVTAPDGSPALVGEVMMALASWGVVTCAEVRVADTTAWQAALGAAAVAADATKLTLEEVQEVLFAAWTTAAHLLPQAATPRPSNHRWSGNPTVELCLSAEHGYDQSGPHLMLPDLIDLTPLGPTDRTTLPEMSVTITTVPWKAEADQRQLLRRALARMVHGFGFLEADEARL